MMPAVHRLGYAAAVHEIASERLTLASCPLSPGRSLRSLTEDLRHLYIAMLGDI